MIHIMTQESTHERPFYLLYGRDARIPTETVLSHQWNPYLVDLDEYKEDFHNLMAIARKLAEENIKGAQVRQKKFYERKKQEVNLKAGERVMVFMPSDVKGENWKLARPFHGPYRVVTVYDNSVDVRLMNRPKTDCICVSLDRVRRCYPEQGDTPWTGPKSTNG